MYVYIYIYIEREIEEHRQREREREREANHDFQQTVADQKATQRLNTRTHNQQ